MSNTIVPDYVYEATLKMLKKENSNMSQYEEFLVDENIQFAQYGHELENLDLVDVDHLNFNSQGNLVVLTPPDMEETCDVALVDSTCTVTAPVSPIGPPARTAFSGGLNFRVEINGADTNRRKYLYSHQLNRIYVDIKADFPVQFHWDFARSGPMFVRATTVFSDESQAEKRVERCLQHTHEVANAEVDPVIVKNVLHSSREVGTRSAPGARDVYYCGKPERPDSWYSVVLACDGRTTEPYSHAYKFVCKNSCPGGINRRAIDIIFTLEDYT
ncbi:hypothetical protein MSG28_005964 [Choristoneura fumiferana]|uniref:Uncharacterized protein n=2 Tax=Choristoneura fumiferana TaxID=7141 RepID=A0ACC0L112_CHOFU|nr:hypothetical protein MSG28_005964 [Choristoneura fumiferana]